MNKKLKSDPQQELETVVRLIALCLSELCFYCCLVQIHQSTTEETRTPPPQQQQQQQQGLISTEATPTPQDTGCDAGGGSTGSQEAAVSVEGKVTGTNLVTDLTKTAGAPVVSDAMECSVTTGCGQDGIAAPTSA